MWPVSDAFRAAVVSPARQMRHRITLAGATTADVLVASGSVSVDVGRAVRRTCSLTVLDPLGNLLPASGDALLTPFGNEVKIEAGFVLADGSTEYVPLGVFVLTDVEIEQAGAGVRFTVSGSDRSIRVSRNRWATPPATIAPGTLVTTAIETLLLDRWPDCPIDFAPLATTVGGSIKVDAGADADPWQVCVKIAEDHGLDLAFDAGGTAVLRQVPDLTTAEPVAEYVSGSTATLTRISRGLTTEGHYNGVIVVGESPEGTGAVYAEAWDTDPASPTRIDGPLGRVPMFRVVSAVTTAQQAQETADAALRKELGASENVSWSFAQNPAHDGFDVVTITRPEVGVDARYIIDSLDIPVGTGTMTGTARTRTVFA